MLIRLATAATRLPSDVTHAFDAWFATTSLEALSAEDGERGGYLRRVVVGGDLDD